MKKNSESDNYEARSEVIRGVFYGISKWIYGCLSIMDIKVKAKFKLRGFQQYVHVYICAFQLDSEDKRCNFLCKNIHWVSGVKLNSASPHQFKKKKKRENIL